MFNDYVEFKRKYIEDKEKLCFDGDYHEGGGDFTTANVTVNDPNALGMLMQGAFPVEGTLGYNFPYINHVAFSDEFGTGKVALYKGNALIDVEVPDEGTITVSGNAEVIQPGKIKVTGDCTITINE